MPANLLPSGRRQSILASIVLRKKKEIDIVLEGETDLVHSYSTFDHITGKVELKFDRDVPLGELAITLEGRTSTYVKTFAPTASAPELTTGEHIFLKLGYQVNGDELPENHLLRAGIAYTVPFTFVVPDQLLPYACSHEVANDAIRKEHVQLPPSLGDPGIACDGHTPMDDSAPAMCRVSYAIHARATTRLASGKTIDIVDEMERIRIVPAREEEPPEAVEESTEYVLRKEKDVKKGILKIGKAGCLTAETTQPRSLRLPHPQRRLPEPVTTITTVYLRFDPTTPDELPPQLSCMNTKLRIHTFFGAVPYKLFPEPHHRDNWSNLHERCITPSYSLADLSRCHSISNVPSPSSIPEPSALYRCGSPFYIASVLVPVSLPNPYDNRRSKTFVPSFHSCTVSRSHVLELVLSYHLPDAAVYSPHITLKCPIQISSEGGIPRVSVPESNQLLVTGIEQQFGLLEARQSQDEMAMEGQACEEDAMSVILAAEERQPALAGGGALPDYNAREFVRRVEGPRTRRVSIYA